jgi:cyclic lactone autoinducer peptide
MKKFVPLLASMLLLIASVASASACTFGQFQPEVPEALRR